MPLTCDAECCAYVCGGTDPLEKAYLCQRVPNSAPFSFSGAVCVVDRVLSKLHQLTVVMAQGEV